MEIFGTLTEFLFEHAEYAHWWIFGVLILAGLNVPVSEDLMLITSGVIASTMIPENTLKLFMGAFLGCYLSDWIAYWIGRGLGPKLWESRWFTSMVSKARFYQMKGFYHRYGFYTLLVGRFIPFGIRNCLFITAGMTHMHFGKFLISDGVACLISNTVLFTLAYTFGKNYESLLEYVRTCNLAIFAVFFVALVIAFIALKLSKKLRFRQGEGV